MDIHEYIRNRIAELRRQKKISETKLSIELGHSRSYFSTMNRDKTIPSIGALVEICDYFGITLADFFANFLSKVEGSKSSVQSELIKIMVEKSSDLDEKELNALIWAVKNLTGENISHIAQYLLKLQK